MTDGNWASVARCLSDQQPLDLDQTLVNSPDQSPRGGDLPKESMDGFAMPSSIIWPLVNSDHIYLGVRVTSTLENPVAIAARLIAMASERGIHPIILSGLDHCGLEQFGLRVERLTGATLEERDICEGELTRFFHISIVVDVDNLLAFG